MTSDQQRVNHHGDRQRVITTSHCIMEWANYCRWPGGPGCKEATPDGPCCGHGDWFVAKHELDRTEQRVHVLPPNENKAPSPEGNEAE